MRGANALASYRRKDLLSHRGQGNLPPDGLPLLHQVAPRLQVPDQPRVDRVFRQFLFREPHEKLFVGSLHLRRRPSRGRHRDDAPCGPPRNLGPSLPSEPSEGDGELSIVELAHRLQPRNREAAARPQKGGQGLAFWQRTASHLGPGEPIRPEDAFLHRDEALRLEPRSRVHDLDEFAELSGDFEFFGRCLLAFLQSEEDLLLEIAQLRRRRRHRGADGTLSLKALSGLGSEFPPDGAFLLKRENYAIPYI